LPTHAGALAIPGEAEDFAEKLLQVLAERPTAQHCRSYVAQHFSWDKTFMKLLDIYDNLYRAA
jgi:glycosyltransferase involved in cell wall biosynthesis